MKPIFLFLVAALSLEGCAFKNSSGESTDAALHRMDGRLIAAKFTWDDQRMPIILSGPDFSSRAGTSWIRELPVTIPAKAPDVIEAEVQFAIDPQDLKSVVITAVSTTGDDLNVRHLGIDVIGSFPAEIGSAVRLKLVGIKTLFLENREQRIFISLTMKIPSRDPITLSFALASPPSRITVLERQSLFRTPPGSNELEKFRILSSQAENRELIERIKLRNDSFQKVRLSIPFKTVATAKIRGIIYSVASTPGSNGHYVKHVQEETSKTWDTDAGWFIFPLRSDLPQTWTGYSQKDLDSIFLAPGESIDFGLYVDRLLLDALAGHASSKPTIQQLSVDAVAHCNPADYMTLIGEENGDGGAWWCNVVNSQGYGFPADTVGFCQQAIPTMRACITSNGVSGACTQAALLDEQLYARRRPHPSNGLPWPIWLSCRTSTNAPDGSVTGFNLAWQWAAINADFKVGTDMAPVTVDFVTQSIPLITRFSPVGEILDTEFRELVLVENGIQLQE